MEKNSNHCKSCKTKTLIRDDTSGLLLCSSCGIVQDFDNFDAQIGGLDGPEGTFIRIGNSGSIRDYSYRDSKIYKAQNTIHDITSKLGLSRVDEIKSMINQITNGEFGQGEWFPILVGACCYVVMRKNDKLIPMSEIVSVIGCCDEYELGRMISRVLEFLDLKLPEFDMVKTLEHAMRTCSTFREFERDKREMMLKQGIFMLHCAMKWFLTTGRRPLPMVAAILAFVAELNGVRVRIDDVAKEVHATVSTSKLRYKELLENLVKVAQGLPWGKNLNFNNIVANAPLVIQYMEMKSRLKPNEKGGSLEELAFDFGDVVSECLRKEVEYTSEDYGADKDYDSKYFEIKDRKGDPNCSFDDGDGDGGKLKISQEFLSRIYSEFKNEAARVNPIVEIGENGRRKPRDYDIRACEDWWSGKSELTKKLLLKQVLEKDVGFDAMPPSFVTGCLAYDRRKQKIAAAKVRIEKIMYPSTTDLSNCHDLRCPKDVQNGKKRKRGKGGRTSDLDWEDCVIETLLLHQVKEEEIEKGHYRNLLDLYVFNSGSM
ncbi:hypothetical protein RJ641_002295 [Dillenia turbinata]|uniref:BRF2-like C-terminal domain-containing protein n=1 Tax=Dillenia turbinata TaxID=194707 RepID=A0AAN8ZC31_9MAGN